ncbi:MAG: hypothetical protein H7Z13_15175 [Ferruginibacter sp.]|nr:hypothetical protein [Ferruginibacter sp.]
MLDVMPALMKDMMSTMMSYSINNRHFNIKNSIQWK